MNRLNSKGMEQLKTSLIVHTVYDWNYSVQKKQSIMKAFLKIWEKFWKPASNYIKGHLGYHNVMKLGSLALRRNCTISVPRAGMPDQARPARPRSGLDFSNLLTKDWGPKKVTIYFHIFYLVKSSKNILFFYLHFTWLCG